MTQCSKDESKHTPLHKRAHTHTHTHTHKHTNTQNTHTHTLSLSSSLSLFLSLSVSLCLSLSLSLSLPPLDCVSGTPKPITLSKTSARLPTNACKSSKAACRFFSASLCSSRTSPWPHSSAAKANRGQCNVRRAHSTQKNKDSKAAGTTQCSSTVHTAPCLEDNGPTFVSNVVWLSLSRLFNASLWSTASAHTSPKYFSRYATS